MNCSVSNLFSILIIGLCFEEDLGFIFSVLVEVLSLSFGLFLKLVLSCSLLGFSLSIFFIVILFELGISWVVFLIDLSFMVVVWECFSILGRALVFMGVFVFVL